MNTTSKQGLIRRNVFKDVLWIFASIGILTAVVRFALGPGSSSGLNDAIPWAFWTALKLACVAMAGGGFTLAAIVYIFHLEKFRPLVRRAILLAFLGYGSFLTLLICDLGLPWRIYMPIIHWQHHSIMFEIAWCVMLYFSVLIMEFSPAILEHPWFKYKPFRWIYNVLKQLTLFLIIAGIVLSTLHQSSLGSLYLITPFRVHPLWYSPLIPLFFFISCIAFGLMALVLENVISSYFFDREFRMDLLPTLGGAAAVVLWIYLAIRLGDLIARGILPGALDGSVLANLFIAKMVLGIALPATLLSIRKTRESRAGLITAAVLTSLGMILNRFTLTWFAQVIPPGTSYFPTWPEVGIGLGIVAGAGLVFGLFTENLAVFDKELPQSTVTPYDKPRFDLTTSYTDFSLKGSVTRRSFIFVVVVTLGIALLPTRIVTGSQKQSVTVQAAQGWNVLTIDGNGANEAVSFDHAAHQQRQGKLIGTKYATEQDMCMRCHHLGKPPVGGPTACSECHSEMYLTVSIFDHDLHEEKVDVTTMECSSCHEDKQDQEGSFHSQPCVACHKGGHTTETVYVECVDCHEEDMAGLTKYGTDFDYAAAPSYKDAMHGLCIECHEDVAETKGDPTFAYCGTCHYEK